MKAKEIFDTLWECSNFELKRTDNGFYVGSGAINMCPRCAGMTPFQYGVHYDEMKKRLEALPWTKVVERPRMPRQDEYPTENGEYITMLDADEHAVWINVFRDGHWLVYDRTHVKWWMPMPDMTGIDLTLIDNQKQ